MSGTQNPSQVAPVAQVVAPVAQVVAPLTVRNFLMSNPQLLNFINNNFVFNIDETNIMDELIYNEIIDDNDKKESEILRLTINLIYSSFTIKLRNKIFMMSYYFIRKGFKFPFKIAVKDKHINYISINDLFNYIKSGGQKRYLKNFKEMNPQNNFKNYECCICLTDFQENEDDKIKCVNCFNLKCCFECFNKINPKRCPQCKTNNFKRHTEEKDINIKFIHNKKTIEKDFNHYLRDDELIFIYLETKKENNKNVYKIKSFDFEIKTNDELKERFFEHIQENLFYFNTNFLFNHIVEPFIDVIDENIFELIIQASTDKQDNKQLFKLLGFIYNSYEQNINNECFNDFYDECINTDGLEHTQTLEFLEEVAQNAYFNEDERYYLMSNDFYRSQENKNLFNNFDKDLNNIYIYE